MILWLLPPSMSEDEEFSWVLMFPLIAWCWGEQKIVVEIFQEVNTIKVSEHNSPIEINLSPEIT